MNVPTRHFAFKSRFAVGMTLVELMVSVAILTGIILIVNSLLVSARRAVGTSQATIIANATARVVTDRLRADLAAISKDGFLAIYTDVNSKNHLVFTAVAPYRSMVDSTVANAARIDYGVTNDADMVLWRRAVLLNAEVNTTDDHEKISLADYKAWDRVGIDYAIYNATGQYQYPSGTGPLFDCFVNPPVMTLPPNSLDEVNALWPCLAGTCSDLKIHWTDGTIDANNMITWYGDNGDGDVDAKDSSWATKTPATGAIEYNAETGGGDDRYCALWTATNLSNWPKALRITFTLGQGESAKLYEVIVDLSR